MNHRISSLFLCALLFSAPALAADAKKKIKLAPAKPDLTTDAGGGGAEQMIHETKNPPPPSSAGATIHMTCTDPQGRLLKAGEAGYNECLQKSQPRVGPNSQGVQAGSQMNLNIGK